MLADRSTGISSQTNEAVEDSILQGNCSGPVWDFLGVHIAALPRSAHPSITRAPRLHAAPTFFLSVSLV